jgi:hypothetical protein
MVLYPLVAELTYKDKELNIKIPIRAKKFVTVDLVCEKCRNQGSVNNVIEFYMRQGKMYKKNDNIPCPECKKTLERKDKELYMLYVGLNKPFIKVGNIVSLVMFGRWKEKQIYYSTQSYVIFSSYKDLKECIKGSKKVTERWKENMPHKLKSVKKCKLKTYKFTKKQLDQAWNEYILNKIAKKV